MTCKKCGLEKPAAEFRKHSANAYGPCRDCWNAYQRAWRERNPERSRAYYRRWSKSDEGKAHLRKVWASDERKAYKRGRYNLPEVAALRKASLERYYSKEEARQKARDRAKNRRALLRGAFVEYVEATAVLRRGNGLCGICGDPVNPYDFEVDHIVPLSRGGPHSYANTQPSHPTCNARKHNKLPEEIAA